MMFTFRALLCLGLTLCPGTTVLTGTLPKPVLRAYPNLVVSKQNNVTFLCEGTTGAKEYHIYKDGSQYTGFTEILLKPGNKAEFYLSKTDKHQAGKYQCRYRTHDEWSEYSDSLVLVVTGAFSKPNLSVQPSPVVNENGNVTLQCESWKHYDRFILTKEGPQRLSWMLPSQYNSSTRQFQAHFSVGPVTSSERWTFRCYSSYLKKPLVWSEPSDPLEILLSGNLHKPTIKAEPGSVIAYRGNVTIWCQGSLDAEIYVLHREGSPKPWGTRTPEKPGGKAKFSIPSVTQQHMGQYHCYCYTSAGWSEPSDTLELVVTGIYTLKPILSAPPGPVVAIGGNMTLQCVSFGTYAEFVLLKEDEKFSRSMDSQYISHNGHYQAIFSMGPVTTFHRGTFRCYGYYKDTPQMWSEPSNPLEIHISGLSKKPSLLSNQGHILDPGKSLTLQCCSDISYDRFVLYKVGTTDFTQHHRKWTQAGPSLAIFTLGSVNSSIGGQYRCYGVHNLSTEWSASSDTLDILISGQLLFTPFLSVKPNSTAHPGDNVTFLCWSSERVDTFILYKEGAGHRPQRLISTYKDHHFQAEFSMSAVTSDISGIYRCYGSRISSPYLLSYASASEELMVSGSILVSSPPPSSPSPQPSMPSQPPSRPSPPSSRPSPPSSRPSPPPSSPSPPPSRPSPPPSSPSPPPSSPSPPPSRPSPPPSRPMTTTGLKMNLMALIGASLAFLLLLFILLFILCQRKQGKCRKYAQKETELQLPAGAAEPVNRNRGSQKRTNPAAATQEEIIYASVVKMQPEHGVELDSWNPTEEGPLGNIYANVQPSILRKTGGVLPSVVPREFLDTKRGPAEEDRVMDTQAAKYEEPLDVTYAQPSNMTLRQETAAPPPSQAGNVPEEPVYMLVQQSLFQRPFSRTESHDPLPARMLNGDL